MYADSSLVSHNRGFKPRFFTVRPIAAFGDIWWSVLSTKIRSVHGSLAGREASDKKCARGIDPALDWTRAPRYCVAAPVVVLMMTPLVPNANHVKAFKIPMESQTQRTHGR